MGCEMTISVRVAALAAAAFIAGAGASSAVTYNFTSVTNNNLTNAAIGAAQLSVDVTDAGSGNVAFTFNNAGPLASSITDIYWDDQAGVLGTAGAIADSGAGVSYSWGASPGNLPGGNAVGFSVSPSGAAADSNAPVQPMGVNPGEWVTLVWSIVSGKTFNDVIAALNLGGDQAGSLRIGIHVQGFANGGSESFVNTPPPPAPVPLPAGGLMLVAGLGAFGLLRRRQKA